MQQLFGSGDHLPHDRAGTQQAYRRLSRSARAIQAHAADDIVMLAVLQRGLGVVLVGHRQVVELIALLFEHASAAMIDDHGRLAGERRVVSAAVRHRRGDELAGTVLVLQALARQGGAASGGADQEATGALVGSRPDQVADALETEHRIVDIERQHRLAVDAVGGRGGDPGRNRAGFGNALFQQLAVGGLLVVQQCTSIFRFVELAHG
ncbi:hypothetical protein D3C75_886490 [compost metagenome]